ncbi:UDP-N-acetylmuramate--L-alanine ligase [Brachyspira hampsonii]|uniref:UDP-N-acetylmuramate--L-alanine ligase n=1 Tax=Brachyspira hampsonii TaxID=1287055 RepID=A0AAC9XLY4_9SPIR|nr:UDP-N-acetylmuramate--L-alanine ligase [Brachyspira hampsonii]ASJ22634.1 UDP-N-acetylmuramate--L-alanine ligase [Brachyspira hampsonii]ELV06531.1 UDP-N-acetylmuramate--L-alanine ligase [Brachyspira hampsonii 30599]MBW5379792.1 UDP-N-acetylmuramate--L-alanine ligase [Brachyspira hampsonii]OEJ19329.1 UDP-N-acetylmuramate--L-alanine ligase [Brachyspira hampsonii]
MFTKRKEKIHFIGIGGIGMSAIASVLNAIGFTITGSDLAKTAKTESLESAGIKVYYGHKAQNIEDDVTAVVTSSAISPTNEEIIEAKAKKITVIPRGEMLAELMRLRYGIAISGSHGKTTTTSLISQIMMHAGLNPVCIIGGNHFNLKSNAACNDLSSEYMVCEADESDGSFLRLSPVINVVTNIDNDHLDYYGNVEALRVAFLEFINKVPFYGCSFLCFEDNVVKDLSKSANKKYYSYGFSKDYDFYVDKDSIRVEAPTTYFTAYHNDKCLGEFSVPLIGIHNVLNSLASIGVGVHLGIEIDDIKEGLKTFEGVGRRLNKLYDKEITLFDDYAHHPTEIKATLSSVKNAYKNRRIIAVFQPHRYSRTELLLNDFESAFNDADEVIISDIYAAGEAPIAGISGEIICDVVRRQNDHIRYVPNIEDLLPVLDDIKKDGDIILTLGAGNIVRISNEYARKLQNS